MAGLRYGVAAAVAGVVVTLLAGLYDNTPAGLVGAVWYGFPFVWLRRLVVAPQYYPWVVDLAGLAYDLAFWIVAFGVILFLFSKRRRARDGLK
jgi:drug/metabolite transporter (DMT)-like permease